MSTTMLEKAQWGGMQVQTMYDYASNKVRVHIVDYVHGQRSSVTTAFSGDNPEEIQDYIAGCAEFFEYLRRTIPPEKVQR